MRTGRNISKLNIFVCLILALWLAGCGKADVQGIAEGYREIVIGTRSSIYIPENTISDTPSEAWPEDLSDAMTHTVSTEDTFATMSHGRYMFLIYSPEETPDSLEEDIERSLSVRLRLPAVEDRENTGVISAEADGLYNVDDYETYTGYAEIKTVDGHTAVAFAGVTEESGLDADAALGYIVKSLKLRNYDLTFNKGPSIASSEPPMTAIHAGEEGLTAVTYKGRPGSPLAVDAKILCRSVEFDAGAYAEEAGLPETKDGVSWCRADISVSFPGCDVTAVLPSISYEAHDGEGMPLPCGGRVYVTGSGAGEYSLYFRVPDTVKSISVECGHTPLVICAERASS